MVVWRRKTTPWARLRFAWLPIKVDAYPHGYYVWLEWVVQVPAYYGGWIGTEIYKSEGFRNGVIEQLRVAGFPNDKAEDIARRFLGSPEGWTVPETWDSIQHILRTGYERYHGVGSVAYEAMQAVSK